MLKEVVLYCIEPVKPDRYERGLYFAFLCNIKNYKRSVNLFNLAEFAEKRHQKKSSYSPRK